MRQSVQTQFRSFNEPLEGVVKYMYLDIKGLVTVGVGNLIDPVSAALELPFQWKNKPGVKKPGGAATKAEIQTEWQKLKDDQTLAHKGHRACAKVTDLELSDASIDDLISRRLLSNQGFLKKQKAFADFENWPADAQMGLLSMAWAMGPGGPRAFHTFSAACATADFDVAAENCRMSEVGNPGLVPRNRADKLCFHNAAAVLAGEADGFYNREMLYYPQMLMKPITITSGDD